MKTIVIIPAYNEQGKIGRVIRQVQKCAPDFISEVVVVNDASTDKTPTEAKLAGATVLSHKANMGVGAAIRTAIDYAIENGYEVCVFMGGDDQDNPHEIKTLLEPILREGYDLVQGSRYINCQRTVNMPVSRGITTRLYTLLFRAVSGFRITDASNGFRAFRLDILQKINIWRKNFNGYDLEPFILLEAIRRGFKVKEVPVWKRFDNKKGFSKMVPLRDWYIIARPLLMQFLPTTHRKRDDKR